MKKKSIGILLLWQFLIASFSLLAQPINESFTDVPTLFTTGGWAQQNLSTPIGTNPTWAQGNPTNFPANTLPDNSYIAANYNNVAGAAIISNWLFTPTRTYTNGDVITFFTRTSTGTYPDNLQVRLSLNGASTNAGTTNTSVGDFTTLLLEVNPTLSTTGYPTTWTQYTLTITGLAAPTSGRVAFRYFVTDGGPNGLNSDYIGIDNYVYTPFGSALAPELTVSQSGEYTLIPQNQAVNMPLTARINNTGTGACADATLTVKVYQLPNTTTPVQTYSSTPTALASGANTLVTLGTYTPPGIGDYLFRYSSSGTGNTVNAADTFNYSFTVLSKYYARDNGNAVQGIGAGSGTRVIVGNNFTINTPTILDSVLFFLYTGAPGLGDTVRVRVRNTVANVPQNTADVAFSAPYVITSSDTSGAVLTLPITNATSGSVLLPAGTYFVGIEKYLTGDNYGLQCANSIFTPNTVYANINNGAFSPLNTLLAGFNYTPIIRLITCNNTTSTATHTACGSFTWINGVTYTSSNSTATYVVPNATGCDSTITLNLTITPVDNATFSYPSNTICTSGSNVSPTINAAGVFSTPTPGLVFANAATGEIDVNNSQNGTYTVTFTTAGTCPNSTTQTLTLTSSPVADFSYDNVSYCLGANNPQIAFGTGASAGTFSSTPAGLGLNTTSGSIDLGNTTPNTYTVTNTIPASGACPQASSTYTLVVNALPSVSFLIDDDTVCTEEPTILLDGGSPIGGTYSGTNVVGNAFTPSTIGTTVLTYAYTDANGCSNSATSSIEVIGCAGIEELTEMAFVSCYPNPTSGLVTLASNEHAFMSKVNCYNALGQLVSSREITEASTVSFDMSQLAKGVYTLEITTTEGISKARIVLE